MMQPMDLQRDEEHMQASTLKAADLRKATATANEAAKCVDGNVS